MQPAVNLLQKSPKAKTIEDIVKPDATMRLHQRLFDRRRKHHIDVQEDNSKSPGISLSTYLVSPKYRKKPKANQPPTLTTTTPMPVLQYSQITRDMPAEDYLASSANHVRSFMDRVSQRYQVFMSQHKPFYYSLSGGAASGWLTNPRARVALAGSALALLMFFTGTPYNPPEGPDNPVGKNPVVIQDTAKNTPPQSAENLETVNSTPPTGTTSHGPSPQTAPSPAVSRHDENPAPIHVPIDGYGGGYGSGVPSSPESATTSPTPTPSPTQSEPPTSAGLIQDIITPTPVTIPGQDIQLQDKQLLETSDITITIN